MSERSSWSYRVPGPSSRESRVEEPAAPAKSRPIAWLLAGFLLGLCLTEARGSSPAFDADREAYLRSQERIAVALEKIDRTLERVAGAMERRP